MHCYIEGLSHNGEGVARIEGKAAFIPFTIPGERAEIEIVQSKKTYLRGRLQRILESSPDRIEPRCPYFYDCGGCSYQHVSYHRQLLMKRQSVQDALKRIGGIDAEVNPVLGMENPWRYRNKIEWHTGQMPGQHNMGFYRPNSQELVAIDSCLLISKEMDEISSYIKKNLDVLDVPAGCSITVRQSRQSLEMMLIFKGQGSSRIDFGRLHDLQGVASLYSVDGNKVSLHYGESTIPDAIDAISFEISPLAFFQINYEQNEQLIATVMEYSQLCGECTLLDAYCGTGSIALSLAASVKKVVGVENDRMAIKDAKRNAFNNGISNCRFIKGLCEEVVPSLEEYFDVVVLDPPRSGCKKELIDRIIQTSPQRIIYVSCYPATLARDLAIMIRGGYKIQKVQPIDMFPQTSHVETVVLLEKK